MQTASLNWASLYSLILLLTRCVGDNIQILPGESDNLVYWNGMHTNRIRCTRCTNLSPSQNCKIRSGIEIDCRHNNYKHINRSNPPFCSEGCGEDIVCPSLPLYKDGEWQCEFQVHYSRVKVYTTCWATCEEGFALIQDIVIRCTAGNFLAKWNVSTVETPTCIKISTKVNGSNTEVNGSNTEVNGSNLEALKWLIPCIILFFVIILALVLYKYRRQSHHFKRCCEAKRGTSIAEEDAVREEPEVVHESFPLAPMHPLLAGPVQQFDSRNDGTSQGPYSGSITLSSAEPLTGNSDPPSVAAAAAGMPQIHPHSSDDQRLPKGNKLDSGEYNPADGIQSSGWNSLDLDELKK